MFEQSWVEKAGSDGNDGKAGAGQDFASMRQTIKRKRTVAQDGGGQLFIPHRLRSVTCIALRLSVSSLANRTKFIRPRAHRLARLIHRTRTTHALLEENF